MEELARAYSSPASSSTQTPCEIEEIEMENQRSPLATSDSASSSSTAAVDKYYVFINHRGEVKKNFAGHLYRALQLRGLRPFLDQQDLQEGLPFPSQLDAVIRNASVHVAVFSPKYAESRWCLHELLLMRQSGAPIIPVFYHVNPADLRWTDQNKTKGYGLSLHELELKKTFDPQTREAKLRYDPATIQKWRDALSFAANITEFDLDDKYDGDEVHMIDKIVERVGEIIIKPGLSVAKHPTGLEDKVTDFKTTVLKQQHAGKIPTPCETEEIEMENQRSSDGASSSSTAAVDKYDVFINHRGEVKKSFAGHLCRALHLGGLRPFLGRQDLQEGLPFPSQLEAVIRNASVHVAVFSPKYAESRWGLDELLLMRQSEAPIIPVFYHVNPADLRWIDQNKTGVYATSLHELEIKKTSDHPLYDAATIQKWRDALSFVADINGFDLNGKYNCDEVHMIDKIVERVGKIIRKPRLYVAKHPTGLNDKVTDFEATVLKQQQVGKIQVAGIVGLGGMGKTTLALELFNKMSSKYNKSFFLSDVREKANKSSLHSVQRELLRGLTQGLPETEVDINSKYEGKEKFEMHLKSAHVLLILDDIDHDDQLEALLPVKDVLRPDSFILITSRYKDVLERSGVEQLCIYKLTGLPRQHSQQLFCLYAFCQTNPLHRFENLVDQFLQVCNGLPLALKVLGALLFGKPESYWDAKLKEIKVQMKVSPDIKNKLKISYDALSEEEQKIFLDITFFFIGESKTSAIAVWDASGWNGLLGLTDLEGKCLVEVDDKNVIHMHDQLRDLGRQIAEEETPRRLWRPTGNIDDWLHNNSAVLTKARGIWLLPEGHSTKPVGTSSEVLGKRERYLLGCDVMNFQLVETEGHLLDRILQVHSPNLLWLSWRHCPHTRLPSWITTKNLRVLKVERAVLKTLWQGLSQAPLRLQELDLSLCTQLERLPDSFGSLSNLHRLDLRGCSQLERLPDSFGSLSNLHSLDLRWCFQLERLPDSFGSLSNLHSLDLSGCFQLERLPDSFGSLSNLHSLDLRGCEKWERLPDSFGSLSNLHSLDLRGYKKLERLPDSFGSLSNLHSLDLSWCEKLERLPDSFGSLSNLHSLDLCGCFQLERLPDSFGSLWNLHSLDLSRCKELERLPDSFGSLWNLHSLDLSICEKLERLPDSFGSLWNLHRLDLSWCEKLERLPDSFGSLWNLHSLDLCVCRKLERLPDSFGSLSNLHSLVLVQCEELERLPDSFGSLSNLHSLDLSWCDKLERLPDSFGRLSNLHSLDLSRCEKLERLPDSFGSWSNLHSLNLSECFQLERLPDSFGSLSSLGYFNASGCANLTISSEAFGNIRTLEHIDLSGCEKVEVWPSQLGHQMSLKVVKLIGTNLKKELPSAFELPSDLEVLWIGNPLLETVTPSLGDLRKLKELRLEYRGELKCLSASVGGSSQLSWLKVAASPIIHTSEVLSDEVVYPNLSELMLEECINLVEVGTLPKALTSVTLISCYNLRSIQGICGLPMLRELHIKKCNELEELRSVETMVSLQRLYAIDCAKLKSIRALAQLTELIRLEVSGCPQLGEMEGVEYCTSLRYLSVNGCPKLQWDERVVERLRQQCGYGFWLGEPNRS